MNFKYLNILAKLHTHTTIIIYRAFLVARGKEPTYQCRRYKRPGFDSWVWKIPWRRKQLPAGSQHEESRPWQRSWGRKLDKTQRRDPASGVPPGFSWTSTPKTRVCLVYRTVLSTLLTFCGNSELRASVNSLLHLKRMSQFKPVWWLSNLPNRSAWTFTTCELFTAPNLKRHEA